ncbi:MAG: S-adenosylmethionine:tRNA ribosyltransferase-isomerase [Prevotella sp.]|nr:S-adenosylmethionine:tRNA ribosyltransferase-isomerase [Prevotella sp.]MCM1074860.1 S-adenosylmethionine:tRNA ribosyltransferase-isomerase [Ruminococcus sp.]
MNKEQVREIRIADYDYPLPDERIARHPCEPRDACKLLVRKAPLDVRHLQFTQLPELLPEGSMLICNNTRVINARIKMKKLTGAEIEIFCLEPSLPADYAQAFQVEGSCQWTCLVGNLKRWKQGSLSKICRLPDGSEFTLFATLVNPAPGNAQTIQFNWTPENLSFAQVIAAAGFIPIPPYLCRESQQSDFTDYQTVYSKIKGSVAAPTAGLHFTDKVLKEIDRRNISRHELTLHVGAGTFQPIKSSTIGGHPMHTETFTIQRSLLKTLIQAKEQNTPITAVGTTTVRTLESLPYLAHNLQTLHITQWEAYSETFDTLSALRALDDYMEQHNLQTLTASTAIMIAPGFKWRIVENILTNFHQPQSTLLLLVDSWLQANGDTPKAWQTCYEAALQRDYRFLSYGDAMLLLTPNPHRQFSTGK